LQAFFRPEPSSKKPDRIFVQSGKVARSGEEKAGQVPAPTPTIEPAEKFREKSDCGGKNLMRHGSHAIAALHNFNKSPILRRWEDQ
jgi:hypothetical protein